MLRLVHIRSLGCYFYIQYIVLAIIHDENIMKLSLVVVKIKQLFVLCV